MALHKHNSDHGPGVEKSKKILRHGEVRGKPLTEKQKEFFGARAGGDPARSRHQEDALKRNLKK